MNFRPLRDLILVKPDPEPDRLGSIAIPQGALPQGHQPGDYHDTFLGTVVAVGPGDTVRERLRRGRISRTLVNKDGSPAPMHTKVGDRVAFPRRPSSAVGNDISTGRCDLEIDGEKYLLFHEEQSAYAVIEP